MFARSWWVRPQKVRCLHPFLQTSWRNQFSITFSGKSSFLNPKLLILWKSREGDRNIREKGRRRHGCGADLHPSTRAVLADPDAESESCFGVYIPLHRHHLVLYSRCYARQLRSTGFSLLPCADFYAFLGFLNLKFSSRIVICAYFCLSSLFFLGFWSIRA